MKTLAEALEPEVTPAIHGQTVSNLGAPEKIMAASIAISLKRIADSLEKITEVMAYPAYGIDEKGNARKLGS